MSNQQHTIESLETRTLLTATLADGLLSVTGTDAAEAITIDHQGSRIYVNVGAETTSFRANRVHQISVDALGGDDTVSVNVARNALIHGGAGADTLIGGSGYDTLDGDQGTDQLWGNKGNDVNVWDPGDGSDAFDGGKGYDTLLFNGSNGNEVMEATAVGATMRFTRDLGNIVVDSAQTEQLLVVALGGNDKVTINNLTGTPVTDVRVEGGDGNDELRGGNLAELLIGGAGNDTIDGHGGDDAMLGGDGDDLLIWDPGDGSDLNVGGAGNDVLLFNGSNGDEVMTATATAKYARTIFTRDLGNIVLDVRQIETIDVEAKGGADKITINDQSLGSVRTINVDLESAAGSNVADDKADVVTVNGTHNAHAITVTGAVGGPVAVTGLAAVVNVARASAADDGLIVSGGSGNDLIDAKGLAAGVLKDVQLYGDNGNDTLLGSAGIDQLFGGNHNDVVDGNQGNDPSYLGRGDDTFVWDPGDGSDPVEGQRGVDKMVFNGSGGNEDMSATKNGNRVIFFRNLGNITMDLAGVEKIDVFALGGDDDIVIGDLSGTGLSAIFADGGAGTDTLDRQGATGVTVTDANFETVL